MNTQNGVTPSAIFFRNVFFKTMPFAISWFSFNCAKLFQKNALISAKRPVIFTDLTNSSIGSSFRFLKPCRSCHLRNVLLSFKLSLWYLIISRRSCNSILGNSPLVLLFMNKGSQLVFCVYNCSFPKRPQPLWKHISDQHPDLWVWLGDGMIIYTPIK